MRNNDTSNLITFDNAEFDGDQLLAEYLQAKDEGKVPAFSRELDLKCHRLIVDTFAKKKKKKAIPSPILARIAAALVAVTICSVLFYPVTAFRTPKYQFILNDNKAYSSIFMDNTEMVIPSLSQTADLEARKKSPLQGFIPEDYQLDHVTISENASFFCSYTNDLGHKISLIAEAASGTIHYDTENADVSQVKILNHDGILVIKDGLKFHWIDATVGLIYHLNLPDMDYGEAWIIAEDIAKCPDWVNLIYKAI